MATAMKSTSFSVGAAPVQKCSMRTTSCRRVVIVRANDDKKLDFSTTTKAGGTGYIEKDTAGGRGPLRMCSAWERVDSLIKIHLHLAWRLTAD